MPADPSRRIVDFASPDDKCPVCKTDRYLNPKLRLLVSPCYHKMCESCLDRIFSLGPAPCPECGQKCRKYEFGVQTFQDLQVEREVDVRRRVGKLFNKTEGDFDSLRAYNNYLEEVEAILFNLIHNIDVPQTEARIAAYQTSNKSLIQANVRSQAAESDAQRARDEAVKSLRVARAARRREREERDRREREMDERNVVDALAGRGGIDVDAVLKKKQDNERQREARMESEERAEEDEMRRRELALGNSVGSGKNGASATSSTKQSADTNITKSNGSGWPLPFSVDMLLDFEGPLASLDDASALIDVAAAPASLGGITASGQGTGYDDPWIVKLPDKDESARLRAAAFDWRLAWERDIRSAVDSIGVAPL